jgi:hypothetical protein
MIRTTKVIGIEGEKIEDFWETEDLPWIVKLF